MKDAIQILNEFSDNIEKIVEKLKRTKNNEDLEKEFKTENEEIGICFFSCNNFIEAMFQSDCLCICFNVSRSDLNINLNPALIKINKIFPTIISGKSFLECVKYKYSFKKSEFKREIVKGIFFFFFYKMY